MSSENDTPVTAVPSTYGLPAEILAALDPFCTMAGPFSDDEWHAARLTGIGGSEAPAVLGVCPYNSREDLFLLKTGRKAPFRGNKYTARGQEREPILREQLARDVLLETGHDLAVFDVTGVQFRSRTFNFMIANLDGLVIHPVHGIGLLEIKTAGASVWPKWTNGKIPPNNFTQVQHCLSVTGLGFCLMYAEGPEGQTTMRIVTPDTPLIDTIISEESDLWLEIQTDTFEAPVDPVVTLAADAPEVPLLDQLAQARFDESAAKALKESLESQIKKMLGERVGIRSASFEVTFKSGTKSEFDSKTFKAENPKLAEQYTKTKETKTFLFKDLRTKETPSE